MVEIMKLHEVLNEEAFQIELTVPGPPESLERVFTWSIPTESMDPRPFLSPNSMLLTSGITLNVTDSRIWDAYVERLASIPVTGLIFALGPAHKQLPDGLVKACESYQIPLLTIPSDTSYALVQRTLQDRLTNERYDLIRKGSELSQQCTELVAKDGTLQDLLQLISTRLERRIAIEDRTGMELLRAGAPGTIIGREEFRLPGPAESSFRLVIETVNSEPNLPTLIRPTTAVLALQLSMALGSASTIYSRHAGQLVDTIFNTDSIPTDELLKLTRDAELDAYAPIGIALIEVDPSLSVTYLRTVSWRVRTRLASEYPRMRFVEDPSLSTILIQGESVAVDEVRERVARAIGEFAGVHCLVEVVHNSAELGLVLRHMKRRIGNRAGVQRAPNMDFDAVVDTLRHPGVESMARRLLEPILRTDNVELLETLKSYLSFSGHTPQICEDLYIHRNTLSHRVQRLEEVLDVDLKNGQTRATLALAVHLTASERASSWFAPLS